MRIGILTFQNTCNYGAMLQAYSLQSILRSMGHDVSIVNYKNDAVTQREAVEKPKTSLLVSDPRCYVSEALLYPKLRRKSVAFERFSSDHLNIGAQLTSVSEMAEKYDAIVVGSDQVWNMRLTGNDLTYFLDGIPRTGLKTISYAASFGATSFPSGYAERCGAALRRFDALSVRELSGIQLVRQLANREAALVLDPTLLAPRALWNKLIKPKKSEAEPYVFAYTVAERERTTLFAQRMAKKFGIGFRAITRTINPLALRGAKSIDDATPEEFLALIANAKLVVTSSFHGLTLSLALGVNVCFSLSNRPGNANSRLESLAALAGVEDRNITNGFPENDIDYEIVDSALALARERSMRFLINALA